MFGKGKMPMSSTARYVMDAGRKAGNVAKYTSPPKKSSNREGVGTVKKTAPMKTDAKHPVSTPKKSIKSFGRLGSGV